MTASFEHADEVRMALRSVVSDSAFDPDSLSNPQVTANLLSDLLPDAPRETSLLLAAISAGVPAMLGENIAQGMDAGTAICTRGVASPVHVVEAYFAAINRRNWPRVWALGGKNPGESYDQPDGPS